MISAMVTFASLFVRLAAHSASAHHKGGRSQRTARLQRAQIADELPRAVLPGTRQRKIPAGLTGHAERPDTGASQVRIQCSDRMIRDYIERTGHREGGDGRAAR